MPPHSHAQWHHGHRYVTGNEAAAERGTRIVFALTLVTMAIEIVAGYRFHSMALTADGWHMSTHALAMGIAAFAYSFARRKAASRAFAFGTGKVSALAGYTSAIVLGAVALLVAWQSVGHLVEPLPIAFDEALPIAALGLAVNLASALILGRAGSNRRHAHAHPHEHPHRQARGDVNLRAAYVHVLADALTSVLAIAALLLVKFAGWAWMDPVMGIVGAGVIANWSVGLMRQSGRTLLDATADAALEAEVRAAIAREPDNEISDLHLWQIGPAHWAAILSVVSHRPRDAEHYKALLAGIEGLGHVTVEVHACAEPQPSIPATPAA